MRCPFCMFEDTQVKDSRPTEDNSTIRRRRLCATCGARFTTFERVQLREITIVKSSGKKVPFDRDKIVRSVKIAARKRDIDLEKIEQLVSGVVRKLESSGEMEVPSRRVGSLIMKALQELDDVAFVRYASVYKNFGEAEDFKDFLGQMHEDDQL